MSSPSKPIGVFDSGVGGLTVLQALRERLPGEHFLYLGDTAVDMQTAVAAGMFPVGVLWGFRDEAELRENGAKIVIGHPSEVLPLLDRNPSG